MQVDSYLCYFDIMNKDLYELSYSLKKDYEKKVLSVVSVFITVFIVINLILSFLIFPLKIKSVSMSSEIEKDSVLLFSPVFKKIKRGDVVLLKELSEEKGSFFKRSINLFVTFFTARQISLDNLNNLMGNNSLVRRVVGLPGDTIYMRDYVVYIKPRGEDFFLTEFELIENPYNVNITAAPSMWDSGLGVSGSFDEMVLGNSEYFVLGDYRNSTVDSRMWGPVKNNVIKAKALLCYFPFSKVSLF